MTGIDIPVIQAVLSLLTVAVAIAGTFLTIKVTQKFVLEQIAKLAANDKEHFNRAQDHGERLRVVEAAAKRLERIVSPERLVSLAQFEATTKEQMGDLRSDVAMLCQRVGELSTAIAAQSRVLDRHLGDKQ